MIGTMGKFFSSIPIIGSIVGGIYGGASSSVDTAVAFLEKKRFDKGCASMRFDELKEILKEKFDEQSKKLKQNFEAIGENLGAIQQNYAAINAVGEKLGTAIDRNYIGITEVGGKSGQEFGGNS